MGVGGAGLRPGSGPDVGYRLHRLVALAGVVDQHEGAVQMRGVAVDGVVDRRHLRVVVLVHAARHRPVEGVDDHQLESEGLDLLKPGAEVEYAVQPSALIFDEEVAFDDVHRVAAGVDHLGDALRRGLRMQFVVEDQHFALFAGEAEPRKAAGHGGGEVGHQPALAGLGRRDDVHGLADAQESVDEHGAHLRILRHQLFQREDAFRVAFRLLEESGEVDALMLPDRAVAAFQQMLRRAGVVALMLQQGVDIEGRICLVGLERRGV